MRDLDLVRSAELRRGVSPAAAVTDNTPFVSQVIDMLGFKACTFAILAGALADADVTCTILVEHADESDFSDNEAVADADLIGTEAGAAFDFGDDNVTRMIGYVGRKRYTRLTITPANNTGNIFLAVGAILTGAEQKPVSNNA